MLSCAKGSSEDSRDHKHVHDGVIPHGRKSFGLSGQCQMSVTVQISMRTHVLQAVFSLQSNTCVAYVPNWKKVHVTIEYCNLNSPHFAFHRTSAALSPVDTSALSLCLLGPAPRTYDGSWSDPWAVLPSSFSFTFWQWQSSHTPIEQNQLYLTLSLGTQAHKPCITCHLSVCVDPSQLWLVMNRLWLCITSVLSLTLVFSDQNIDTSHLRGK